MSADGRWNVVVKAPGSKQELTVVLQSDGQQLNGTITQNGKTSAIVEGTVNGAELKWALPVTTPVPMKLRFTVTVDGDEMSGRFKPGILPSSPVTGRRA